MNISPQLKKIILIGSGVVMVGLLVWIFILGLQSRGKTATIEIQSAVPNDAAVTIDGNKVGSNSKNGITPGKHTVVAKRSGFEDKTQDVDVKQGETKVVRLLMTPNGEEGYNWLRSHPDAAMEYEGMVGEEVSQESAKVTQTNPLIAHLPEVRATWRVDYGQSAKHPNDPYAVAIIITTAGSDLAKNNALDWIRSEGFNPDDYEIIYKLPPQPGG